MAVLALPAGATLRVRSATPVWVRGETRVLADRRAVSDAPLSLRLDGERGHAGERAAFEIVVEATGSEGVAEPVVEVTLPAAAAIDERLFASLRGTAVVRRVEGPDGAGVLRLRLAPLGPHGVHHVPLPLRWRGEPAGAQVSLEAYERSRPWLRTGLPGAASEGEVP